MKSKSFYFIIGLMILTLIGLVTTQLFWFNKTYKVAEKEFDENVNSAMNDVIREMKSRDLMFVLKDTELGNIDLWTEEREDTRVHIINDTRTSATVNGFDHGDSARMELTIRSKSSITGEETTIIIDSVFHDSEMERITALEELDSDWINLEMEHDLDEIVSEIIVQYSLDEDPVDTRLNNLNLDSLITEKLKIHDVALDFQYGITNGDIDSLLIDHSQLKILPENGEIYTKDLFQDDIFKLDNQLLLHFGSKSSFIFKELRTMLVVLFLLALLMVATFIYALSIIWKQKQLDVMKNDFINNMTHEFKTPVATINLALDSMKHVDVLSDVSKVQKFNSIIRSENNRINRQVERVLNIAQFSNGNGVHRMKEIDLIESINTALKIMELPFQKSNAEVTLNCTLDNRMILGDKDHLENLWINLLDNALKYSKEIVKINIDCSAMQDSVVVEIRDNGIGMTSKEVERIFENFYRGSNGDLHQTKGFGLGMSYVKNIMEIHDGNVSVTSEKGVGTKVLLTFKKRME